jgi:hypothetical protein
MLPRSPFSDARKYRRSKASRASRKRLVEERQRRRAFAPLAATSRLQNAIDVVGTDLFVERRQREVAHRRQQLGPFTLPAVQTQRIQRTAREMARRALRCARPDARAAGGDFRNIVGVARDLRQRHPDFTQTRQQRRIPARSTSAASGRVDAATSCRLCFSSRSSAKTRFICCSLPSSARSAMKRMPPLAFCSISCVSGALKPTDRATASAASAGCARRFRRCCPRRS